MKPTDGPMRISVLMTCHNRRQTTLGCLRALYLQDIPERIRLDVFLVDDGSTDGTSSEVMKCFPQVKIIQGTGDLYWCGGTRLAWQEALKGSYDYYLWLNDDTMLLPGAVRTLLKTAEKIRCAEGRDGIVAGSCRDRETKQHTYGGRIKRNSHARLASEVVPPAGEPIPCDTMNGNIVLVSRDVVNRIGILSPEYTHFMGDVDYGLRAKSSGIPIFVAPDYLGECSRNGQDPPWTNPRVPLRARLKNLCSAKGLPPREWFTYVKRHTGAQWPIYFCKPLVRVLFPRLWHRATEMRR